MSKIIFVPQYPSRLRYQEWWFDEFRLQFEKNKLCITLGEKYLENKNGKNKKHRICMICGCDISNLPS